MSWKQGMYAQGYLMVEITLDEWDKPVLFWYKIDIGDKAMKDFPIIDHCFVTDSEGNNISSVIRDEEWKQLESAV